MNITAAIEPEAQAAIRKDVTDFLSRHISTPLASPSENIFKGGYVNSLFVMQLVNFVETSLGVSVQDDDLDIKNFDSVDHITAFVSGKKLGAPAARGQVAC